MTAYSLQKSIPHGTVLLNLNGPYPISSTIQLTLVKVGPLKSPILIKESYSNQYKARHCKTHRFQHESHELY